MDEVITITRSALEEALFNLRMGSATGTMLEKTRTALTFASSVMTALEPGINAAKVAAMSTRQHGTQFQDTLPPAVAPQPLQNAPQAAISTPELPSPTPQTLRRPHRKAAQAAAAPDDITRTLPVQRPPEVAGPPATFSTPFVATPMPTQPFAPPAAPAPQANPSEAVQAPIPPVVVEHTPMPNHPFGMRPTE